MAEKKTNKKVLGIIIAIIVILLIVAIIGGIFVFKNANSTGTEWGDIYYKHTKDISENLDRISEKEYDGTRVLYEYGLPDATHKDDVTAEFIDVNEDNTPEMILHYSNGTSDNKCISILHIVDNRVDLLTSDSGDEIELLYNIEKNEYNYYIHHIANNGLSEEYKSLKRNEQGYSDDYANFEKDELETKFDQTFIKIDTPDNTFQIKPNMSEEEIKSEITTTVKDYKDINNIVTDDVKVATNQKVEEIKRKQEEEKIAAEEKAKKEAEEKAKAEEMKITQSNVLSKIGDHLKFFSGCYLGRTYGIGNMYKTVDVTGKVNVPGTDSSYEMSYEVVGLNSVASLNANFEKCMTKEIISKLKGSQEGDVTKDLHDYNGKVYWVRGGIGDGSSMDYKKAKVISSEGDTSIVQVEEVADLPGIVVAKVDLTIKYDESTSSYKITNYTKKNV